MDDYWDLMPQYQGVDLEDLTLKRALFGVFPTFRDSPLQPGFARVLQVCTAGSVRVHGCCMRGGYRLIPIIGFARVLQACTVLC